MKKFLFVLIAICLFAVPAFAQTQDNPVVTNWEDLEADYIETGYSGTFYSFPDLGIELLVPGGLDPVELSEESIENGAAGVFATEDGELYIAVTLRDLECETLTDVAELALSSGENMKFGGFYQINGLDAIMFYDQDADQLTSAIPTITDGYFIQVTISPMSNEALNSLSGFIMGSIRPLDEE